MEEKVFNVSQVNKYVKMLIDSDAFLNNINITGEITNFKAHYTGHFYFTLKDENSSIKCVMFKSAAQLVNFKPEDGMKVVVSGQINVFERDGVYQIYCRTMKQAGLGELYIAYEKLKKKLQDEGLFDEIYKKKIPFLPDRVGVITSKTGAVIKDIINVSTRRYNDVDLLIYPAAVQGVNVAKTVISGIKTFNNLNNVDVIIIARGGGSFEDLFGFNDENLAREVFNSKIPIVSAVGHETDFTICDFVSDLRAPTPSAAAELVYPKKSDILIKISTDRNRNILAMNGYINRKKEYLKRIKASKLEKIPYDIINKYRMQIDKDIMISKNAIDMKIEKYRSICIKNIAKLDALSPLKTLTRGYSVVENVDGKIVKKVSDVNKNDDLCVILQDGKIQVRVK